LASYHLAVKSVSRSTGRSAPAAAAYRSGQRLLDERTGLVHDYTRRSGVEATAILTPVGAAWAQDRAALWNAAEAAEKRKDAKVAREYEVALPAELDAAGRLDLAREFAAALVDRYGVVADIAVHKPGKEGDQRNWHAHVLTTTRAADESGLGAKTRTLDVAQSAAVEIEALRALWAEQTNAALERAGVVARVDHRSYERRGLDAEPTERVATATYVVERRGAGKGLEAAPQAVEVKPSAMEIETARQEARSAEAEVINLEAERAKRDLERQGEADRTRWRSMSLSALQWEVNTLRPDRGAAFAAEPREPAYREAKEAAEKAEGGAAKARLKLLDATETVRSLNQKAQRYRERQGLLGRVRFWLQDKGVLEISEWKRLQIEISETKELAAERKGILDSAEKLHAEAKKTLNELHCSIAGAVDEALVPEYRRYEAAQSVLDERIEEDRRHAAEVEAERRVEEIRRRVDAEIEREQREAVEQQRRAEIAEIPKIVRGLVSITPTERGTVRFRFAADLSPEERERQQDLLERYPEERRSAVKAEVFERELQANREKDQGMDMMD